jgi:hypothetical protein
MRDTELLEPVCVSKRLRSFFRQNLVPLCKLDNQELTPQSSRLVGYTVCRSGARSPITAVLLWLALIASQSPAKESPAVILEKCCEITTEDLGTLDAGQALGRLIKLGDDADIAIMGAVRLTISKEAFIDWYRRVENYKYSSMVKEAVQFHVPPRPEDVSAFVIDANHIKLLRDCKSGKCGLKFSNEEIARSRTEVDWNAPNASAKADALAKSILLQHVERYMKQGDGALPKYNDKPEEMDVLATYKSILNSSPYIKSAFPKLFTQLSDYRGTKEGTGRDDLFYWSRELYGFGLKPLINVVHTSIYTANPSVTVIATKQIWASHYYDGSLGITVLVDANPGTYLIYMNRSRIDLLRDAGFKRWLVKKFAPGAIRKEVTGLKRQVETNRPANASPR